MDGARQVSRSESGGTSHRFGFGTSGQRVRLAQRHSAIPACPLV